ncbi:hypothetical protein M427DRAFT_195145 [Gonapodya prolifera JEL478]|uniref:Uncharacterized protein n=1 Tax=Gonapodya prolifera (strain JEL478) TaxID=1344416 RepID=A0A139APZ9_GONPJ|nr:hypothetical protein M427DRAFT_195145 [Gonapodya prolifera JEL478]|eukprot:KXS18583.1 hypothetical protein M427DRAFT_195145 [Gonapodya prolifera JEL478]
MQILEFAHSTTPCAIGGRDTSRTPLGMLLSQASSTLDNHQQLIVRDGRLMNDSWPQLSEFFASAAPAIGGSAPFELFGASFVPAPPANMPFLNQRFPTVNVPREVAMFDHLLPLPPEHFPCFHLGWWILHAATIMSLFCIERRFFPMSLSNLPCCCAQSWFWQHVTIPNQQ